MREADSLAELIMGIDTSLRSTGVAVIAKRGNSLSAIDFDVFKNSPSTSISNCLLNLHQKITRWIKYFSPDAVAIEDVFFCKNFKTAFVLGEARGAVITSCAISSVPVFEYSPRKVKQAVAGSGSADKLQVKKMVKHLLVINDDIPEDAADAMAIALCHVNSICLNKLLNVAKPI
jgi:crossover junction endodeoxyribonuclease RuvC